MISGEQAVDEAVGASATVGERLRAAREARGMSVAEVVQVLKFSVRQIDLVERNAWAELPGQTFVRGCVRNYAKLLQVDPLPLLKDLESENLPEKSVLVLPGSTNATLPVRDQSRGTDLAAVFGGLLLVFVAVGAYFLVPEDLWRGKRNVGASKLVAMTATSGATTVSATAPSSAATLPPAAEPATAAPALVAAASAAPSAADPAKPNGNAVLRFEFDQASWVEVRDRSGALLHSQNNAAGTVQDVSGPLPLAVVVGDARRVRVFNGSNRVDLVPHTNAQSNVARLNIE